jgi:hypothetical protein
MNIEQSDYIPSRSLRPGLGGKSLAGRLGDCAIQVTEFNHEVDRTQRRSGNRKTEN